MAFITKRNTVDMTVTPRPEICQDSDVQVLDISINDLPNLLIFNVYNEKQIGSENHKYTVERKLSTVELPARAIICGDFNAHHSWWNSRVNNPVKADALVQWLKQQKCELINTPDESTYQKYCTNGASSVLDLTFATQATAEIVTDWSIYDNWSTGSDHEVIYFSILSESVEFVANPVLSTLAYNIDKANWPEFHGVLLRGLCELSVKLGQLLGESPTNDQMDKAAELVQTYISGAADSAIPDKKSLLFSKRWWTQELLELRTLMARSRRL